MAPQPATRQSATWRTFLRWIRPYRGQVVAAGLLLLLSAAGGLSLPLVAQLLVTRVAEGGRYHAPIALVVVLVSAGAMLSALGWYLLHRTAITLIRDARAALVSRLLRMTMPVVDRCQPGDLLARLAWDTTVFRGLTGQTLVGLGINLPIIVAAVALMAYLDPGLLVITLAVALVAAAVLRFLVPLIRRSSLAAHDAVGNVTAGAERVLGGIRTIRAAGAEPAEEATLHSAADRARDVSVRAQVWSLLAENLSVVTYQLSFVAVLAVGGSRVATGSVTVGTLVAFLLYLFYLIGPLQGVVAAVAAYQSGVAGLTRIEEVLAYPTEPVHQPAEPATTRPPLALEFRAVRFSYDGGCQALRGLSFTVPAGGTTALVGLSGSGKSTVFGLLERFYDHDDGEILVDGRDIRDWRLPELRQAIGYVEQDAPVLAGSLRDNLLLGAPDATEAELRAALARARLRAFVEGLPDGLDTEVGHRGTALSGGERQRVAIARALLRRPRLLLLDEATSQLDAVNEAAFRDAVHEIARTVTVVVVAHRLSTVARADHLVVLDNGVARAAGRHADLAACDELYAELLSAPTTPALVGR